MRNIQIADSKDVVNSSAQYFLIIRSFRTKVFAERYVRKIEGELTGVQVFGENRPFRVGFRLSNFKEAKEARNKLVEKFLDCWILQQ